MAGNTAAATGPDIYGAVTSSSSHNLVGVNPDLATAVPADNGSTQTFALLSNSPALAAGGALTAIAAGHAVSNDPNDTTIYVNNAAAIAVTPGDYYILIDQEEMLVTNVNLSNNTLTVQRGINGTAASHDVGAGVYLATDQHSVSRATPPDIGDFQATPANPTVSSVSTSAASGTYGIGAVFSITVSLARR